MTLPFALAIPAGPGWLQERRTHAAASAGVPTSGREDFRHTSLRAIPTLDFAAASGPVLAAGPGSKDPGLGPVTLPRLGADVTRVVLVDGHFQPSLSGALDGVSCLMEAIAGERPGVVKLGALGSPDPLTALSLAAFAGGAFVHVAGGSSPRTIELVQISTGALSLPRVLVVAEAGAEVTLLERHLSLEGASVSMPVTEVHVGVDATVRHARVQSLQAGGWLLASTLASVAQGGRLESHVVSLGGSVSRAATHVSLDGVRSSVALSGVFAPAAGQKLDHYTSVTHAAPGGTSDQVYKGVVSEGGEGSVVARVAIAERSVNSSAKQLLRALLLGPSARANLRPQLEIDCDEVKAAHGASVGQLDANQLFFLQARGLSRDVARALLIRGFIDEVLLRLPSQSLARELTRAVSRSADPETDDEEP